MVVSMKWKFSGVASLKEKRVILEKNNLIQEEKPLNIKNPTRGRKMWSTMEGGYRNVWIFPYARDMHRGVRNQNRYGICKVSFGSCLNPSPKTPQVPPLLPDRKAPNRFSDKSNPDCNELHSGGIRVEQ